MVKCFNCHKEVKQHDGKRHKLYCNEACRKAFGRKTKLLAGENLTKKAYPDIIPGQTNSGQPLPDKPGHKCWSTGECTLEEHKDYKMTAYEQANYKPADQLGPGEFNPVSKPGDADYVGVAGGIEKGKTPQAGGGVENDK